MSAGVSSILGDNLKGELESKTILHLLWGCVTEIYREIGYHCESTFSPLYTSIHACCKVFFWFYGKIETEKEINKSCVFFKRGLDGGG